MLAKTAKRPRLRNGLSGNSPLDRNQVTLFASTLDESISQDHPVRLFGETLDALDFIWHLEGRERYKQRSAVAESWKWVTAAEEDKRT